MKQLSNKLENLLQHIVEYGDIMFNPEYDVLLHKDLEILQEEGYVTKWLHEKDIFFSDPTEKAISYIKKYCHARLDGVMEE